jgi:hypothetical protein
LATDAEMVAAIKATLLTLYAKQAVSTSIDDRRIILQDITKLEASLANWERRQSVAAGSRPRVANIALDGGL